MDKYLKKALDKVNAKKQLNSKEALALTKHLVNKGSADIIKLAGQTGKDAFAFKEKSDKEGKILYPTEVEREITEALLGQAYLVRDEESGNLLPNYNVTLESFPEEDNSISLIEFVDHRRVERNSKLVFQTDSIVSSKGSETNSTADDTGINTKKKALRNVELICKTEYGTETTEVNIRDASSYVAFDLLSSDMEQHDRMNKLIENRFILKLMIEGSEVIDSGEVFDTSATGTAKNDEYKRVGEALYTHVKDQIIVYKETMTKFRPGGFGKGVLYILISPLAARAIVDYQASLPASDKAFVVAAEGELYNYSIEGVPVYETNLLKGGQRLDITNAAGEITTEYANDDNIELIIGIKNYVKYVDAEPFINSSPVIINNQEVPHVIGQYTEGMHDGAMIIDGLFKAISFARVGDSVATPNQITETTAELDLNGSPTLSLTWTLGTDSTGAELPAPVGFVSSNPAVATVDSTGLITAVAVGEATITATDANGSVAVTVVDTTVVKENKVEKDEMPSDELELDLD